MFKNEKILAALNRETQRDEIRRVLDAIPKDVTYTFKIGEVYIGHIFESYHASVRCDGITHEAICYTNYHFSAVNVKHPNDDGEKYFDCLEFKDAKKFILNQIPSQCHDYVEIIMKQIEN
jgi:hypothetical protein